MFLVVVGLEELGHVGSCALFVDPRSHGLPVRSIDAQLRHRPTDVKDGPFWFPVTAAGRADLEDRSWVHSLAVDGGGIRVYQTTVADVLWPARALVIS
jgi:hypothetical protein